MAPAYDAYAGERWWRADMVSVQQAVPDVLEFAADALESYLQCLPGPAFAVDRQGVVVCGNDAMMDQAIERLSHGCAHFEQLFPDYYFALGGPRSWHKDREVEITRKLGDGSTVFERIWVRRLPNDFYIILVFNDTRVRALEAASAQSARLASLGFMVASVCHEISNPLSAVHSMVQILQTNRNASGELMVNGLANIAANIKRILELSRRLVGYCRVDDRPKRVFHVDEALADAIEMVRLDPLGRQVVFDHLSDGDATLYGSQAAIEEVFTNILFNAVQAMNGSGRIAITTQRLGTGMVEVAIRDSGPGVPPQHLGKLFEPFFTTKAVGQGTGLGLAISSEIAHEHGGTIRVENNSTQGACFVVEIPFRGAHR